jgi:hypothetical protein
LESARAFIQYIESNPEASIQSMFDELSAVRESKWINLGGQLIAEKEVDLIRQDIGEGKLNSWNDIHQRYDMLWERYPQDKQKHALATLCLLYETDKPDMKIWQDALEKMLKLQLFVCDQVYLTRKKDYDNPFRQITYRDQKEMNAALGTIDENSFIIQVGRETDEFKQLIVKLRNRS